jgi:hypothetical protein
MARAKSAATRNTAIERKVTSLAITREMLTGRGGRQRMDERIERTDYS